MAWGKLHLFQMPDGSHLYGREFELLPAGTMFDAAVVLHGIIGATATVDDDNVARVEAGGTLWIYPTRQTDSAELELYESDITEQYWIRELQDAQG
jgi:hypothetical protein